jgi:hypothetical protein
MSAALYVRVCRLIYLFCSLQAPHPAPAPPHQAAGPAPQAIAATVVVNLPNPTIAAQMREALLLVSPPKDGVSICTSACCNVLWWMGGGDADGRVDDACCVAVRVQFVVAACIIYAVKFYIMIVLLWLWGVIYKWGCSIAVSFHELGALSRNVYQVVPLHP